MAEEKDLSKKIGLTPAKAMLIGALSVTLAGVLYVQFGASGGGETAALEAEETAIDVTPLPPRPRAAAAAPASNVATPVPLAEAGLESEAAPHVVDPSRWHAPGVAIVAAYDPFALPPAFPQPAKTAGGQGLTSEGLVAEDAEKRASDLADAVARLQTELESLRSRGVSVIVRERHEYAAMIGDRTVRVGDEINGFTVTAIEPDGVRVEKKVQE